MTVTAAIISIVLALACAASGVAKIRRAPALVASLTADGFPESRIPLLAIPLLAAAVGLVVGLWVTWIGVAAAIGLVVYFVLAIGFHLRAGNVKGLPGPLVFLVLAALVLLFRALA